MAVDLDLPYEDEPLFGVIARYLHDMRVSVFTGTLRTIFGYFPSLPLGLAYGLEHVAIECQHVWPWDADEIAERMTLYPYYASLLPAESAIDCIKQTRERGSHRSQKKAGLLGALRYCDACRASDLAEGRPPYWRREHLLPGVLICPRHAQWLVEVDHQAIWKKLPWPTPESVVGFGKEVRLDLTSSQSEACLRVAQMSAWLLHSRVSVVPENLVNHFRQSARAGGFALGFGSIRGRDLKHSLMQHFGESVLRHLETMPRSDQSWLSTALRKTLPIGRVYRTVLLAEFLSSLPTEACDDAWPFCPNFQSMHGAFHPVSLRQRSVRGYLAKCSCGAAFTYKGVVNGVPQNVKPTRYGFLAEEVKRLRDAGRTRLAIATELEIAPGTVTRLCKQDDPPGNGVLSTEAKNAMIEEWQQLKKALGSAKAVSAVNQTLYVGIRRYAREYL
jgi:hypothetical protein